MCFILNISQYVLVPIITSWLTPEDYIQFDSALCKRKPRKKLSTFILYHRSFQEFLFPPRLPLSVRLFEWAHNKKFQFSYFTCMTVTNKSISLLTRHNIQAVEGLFFNLQYIKQLDIAQCHLSNMNILCQVIGNCVNLEVFFINNTDHAVDEVLFTVARSCPILRVCNISGCKEVYEFSVLTVLKSCPALTELNVSNCAKMSTQFIGGIVAHSRKPLGLNIFGCTSISKRDLCMLSLHMKQRMVQVSTNCTEWNDVTLRALLWWSGQDLTALDLCKSYSLTDDSLCEVALACPHLRDVNLSHCYAMSDYALIELANALPQMKSLNLEYCVRVTDKGIDALTHKCKQFQRLSFFGNSNISPRVLTTLVNANCASLVELIVVGMFLGDADIISISRQCTSLAVLDVSLNADLTDLSVATICESLRSLQKLHFHSCPLITDRSLIAIATKYKHTLDLDHSKCSLVTDRGATAIAECCTGLARYNMSRCPLITNNTLISITRNSVHLKSLTCSHCGTNFDLQLLVALVERLKKLRLLRNDSFSNSEVASLTSIVSISYPDLVVCNS